MIYNKVPVQRGGKFSSCWIAWGVREIAQGRTSAVHGGSSSHRWLPGEVTRSNESGIHSYSRSGDNPQVATRPTDLGDLPR